jgi:hypothetical protein
MDYEERDRDLMKEHRSLTERAVRLYDKILELLNGRK